MEAIWKEKKNVTHDNCYRDDEDDLFGYARRNDLEKAKVLLSEDPQLVNSKDADVRGVEDSISVTRAIT